MFAIYIYENIAILRGSFHQANDRFNIGLHSRGRQCTGIAAVECIIFCLRNPNIWCSSDIDYIVVIVGDKQATTRILLQPVLIQIYSAGIKNRDYLALSELLPGILYTDCKVNIIIEN